MSVSFCVFVLFLSVESIFGTTSLSEKVKKLEDNHTETIANVLESTREEFENQINVTMSEHDKVVAKEEERLKINIKGLQERHNASIEANEKWRKEKLDKAQMDRAIKVERLLDEEYERYKNEFQEVENEILRSRSSLPRLYSCDDARKIDASAKNGKFQLFWNENDTEGYRAWCEFDDDGNHLIILRRVDDSVDFSYKRWEEYKRGFGLVDRNENFWIGLESLHKLTGGQTKAKLSVVMRDMNGTDKVAKYSSFSIGGEEGNYTMAIEGFSGTVQEDALAYSNDMPFSTTDRDNDQRVNVDCAEMFEAAGWFGKCPEVSLMGEYNPSRSAYGRGLIWKHWDKPNSSQLFPFTFLSFVEMRITGQ